LIPIEDTPEQRRRHFPYVTLLLIGANIALFLYSLYLGSSYTRLIQTFGVVPAEITTGRDLWPPSPIPVYLTLFTSMFLHAGFIHVAGNMIFLWVFGDNVEDALGHIGFLAFYLICGVAASMLQIVSDPLSLTPNIGASGAIAGVMAAYILLFPRANVRTLLFAVPFITVTRISALLLIALWFLFQAASALIELGLSSAGGGGIAFWAHIGGFMAGLIIVAVWKGVQGRPTGAD